MNYKEEVFGGLDSSRRYHPERILPKTKIAILSPNTSTEVLGNLQPDEVAVIPYTLVPYGYREGPEARETFPRFLKRGPTVQIPTPKTLEEALEGTGPTRKRFEIYQKLHDPHSELIAAGMSWYCPQDRMHRKVSAHDVLEGMMLYAFSEFERSLSPTQNKTHLISVHQYGVDKENKETGASVVVDVPSRSRNARYRVKLHHFPFLGSDDVWVWMQLQSEHSECGSKDFGDIYWQRDEESKKRRKLHDIVFCPHDVAAYLAVSAEETQRVIKEQAHPSKKITLQPFPLFTQHTVNFWKKLCTQTFFGSPLSTRPLREYEIELELQRFLARQGQDSQKTMYTSDKIRDYNWEPSLPLKG